MTLVIDASVVLSALTTDDPAGRWAEEQLMSSRDLVAPHHFHLEVTNVLRRAQLAGQLDATIRLGHHPSQVLDSPVAVAEDEDRSDAVGLAIGCCSVDVCDEDLAVDAVEVRLEVMVGPFGWW